MESELRDRESSVIVRKNLSVSATIPVALDHLRESKGVKRAHENAIKSLQ
jgi:hypothetical protein